MKYYLTYRELMFCYHLCRSIYLGIWFFWNLIIVWSTHVITRYPPFQKCLRPFLFIDDSNISSRCFAWTFVRWRRVFKDQFAFSCHLFHLWVRMTKQCSTLKESNESIKSAKSSYTGVKVVNELKIGKNTIVVHSPTFNTLHPFA